MSFIKTTEEERKRNKTTRRTELGEEEQEHEDGGSERDDTAGERAAVEILVDFRVRVEVAELAHYAIHDDDDDASIQFPPNYCVDPKLKI